MKTISKNEVTRTARNCFTATRGDLGLSSSFPTTIRTDLGNGEELRIVQPKNGDYSTLVYKQAAAWKGGARITLTVTR